MFTKQFLFDALERALKTFAQTLLATLTVGGATTGIHELPWVAALSIAATATVLSLLTSVASLPVGNQTASMTTAVEPAGKHAKDEPGA